MRSLWISGNSDSDRNDNSDDSSDDDSSIPVYDIMEDGQVVGWSMYPDTERIQRAQACMNKNQQPKPTT